MELIKLGATVFISASLSIIAAYVTAKLSSYSRDVVGERKEWRDMMRSLTVEAVQLIKSGDTQSQRYQVIFSEFRLRLNPDDSNDNDILETLKKSMMTPGHILAGKLLAQVSRLLKHDWERAKAESRVLKYPKPDEVNIRMLKSSDYLD